MKPKQEAVVKGMGKYNFKKIACNHCTGEAAVKKMIELDFTTALTQTRRKTR